MNDRQYSQCPDCAPCEEKYPGIRSCISCGLARTVGWTQPSDAQDYLIADDAREQLRIRYFKHLFRKYLCTVPPGRALDVGCARGEFVRVLARQGWTAHGIDAYHEFPADNQRFFRASLASFATAERYDLLTMIHTFEHIADPMGALEQAKQLLRPGGALLIVVPNFGGLWARQLGRRWDMLNPEHHIFHYTVAGLRNVLQRSGFFIKATHTYSGFYAPSPWQTMLAERKFYERGFGAYQPFRSLIFRANTWAKPILNRIVDWRNDGAEIHMVSTLGDQETKRVP
jgi:2-polyprenyl-3-methyl-5-hydroxy-6-metoxy-1,4-benzoquinol methylase